MSTLRSPLNIAWLAGLFEGEGCAWLRESAKTGKRNRFVLQIAMTDEDIVRRAHAIAGVGSVHERTRLTKGGKRVWTWSVTNAEHAAGLAMTIYTFLGSRRQARIRELLAAWKVAPIKHGREKSCKHGHPLSGDNLVIERTEGGRVRKRRCRECLSRRQREYNARLVERRAA